MTTTHKHTIEVLAEDQEILERCRGEQHGRQPEEAPALGYRTLVAEQLDFKDRMEKVVLPRLQEMRENPSIGLTVEEAKARTAEMVRKRRRKVA